MIVVGFGLGWIGYTLLVTGYSWVKGYDLSFSQIASPTNYYKGTWPPPLAPDTVIIPNGTAATTAQKTAHKTGATTAQINKEAANAGRFPPGSVAGRL